MKRLLLLFIPLMFFFGCEEENNNESTECLLYGTWEFYSEDGNDGSDCLVYCNANISDAPCSPTNTSTTDLCSQLTFNENGSFTYSQENPNYFYQGTWSGGCDVNNVLEMNSTDSGLESYLINSIDANSLILTDGEYYRLVLKK